MVRALLSTLGLVAEFAAVQCHGVIGACLGMAGLTANLVGAFVENPLGRLVDRLTGEHLPPTSPAAKPEAGPPA